MSTYVSKITIPRCYEVCQTIPNVVLLQISLPLISYSSPLTCCLTAALHSPGDKKAWISSNKALVAFVRTSITKARFPHSLAPTQKPTSYVSVATNGCKTLDVPPEYVGNVVFCSMTELPLFEFLLRKPR
ncbi:transferase family protein [Bipolaris maydis]|nr:transferase family protein [Bipolaris maydis]